MKLFLAALLALTGCGSKHVYADGSTLEDQLEREITALTMRNRQLQAEVSICAAIEAPDSVHSHLKQIFYESKAEVTRDGITAVLLIPWDMLLDDDQEFTRAGKMTLDLTAAAINVHPTHRIEIVSYLPTTEKDRDTHWQESFAAAQRAALMLTDEFSVAESRLVIASGSYQHDDQRATLLADRAHLEIRLTPPLSTE